MELGNDIIVEFTDSGKGIPEDSINKIFVPLFTSKQKSTGLGLVSCKNIIELHGGKIFVKNNPTTFTITLPKTISQSNSRLQNSLKVNCVLILGAGIIRNYFKIV